MLTLGQTQDEQRATAPAQVRSAGVPRGPGRARTQAAFTLMEVLLALATSAIVLAAIGGVFFTAMRLRERTSALVDQSAPMYRALGFIRRDLQCALPPGGVLAGEFRAGALSGVTTGLGNSGGFGLQFSTATGVIRDETPWGDVQEVVYELRNPGVRNRGRAQELVRTVSRNLLTTTSLDAAGQVLLDNVERVEFACFDGLNWLDTWDSSLGETNLPLAVRVRIHLAVEDTVDRRQVEPIEMVVPLMNQVRTTETNDTATAGAPE